MPKSQSKHNQKMKSNNDRTKLPKWAQEHMATQDRVIRDLEKEVKAQKAILTNTPDDALQPDYLPRAAYLDPHRHNIPIADGHVRYMFNDNKFLYIDTRFVETDYHDVYLDIHGSNSVVIKPVASNLVHVCVERH